MMYNEKVSLHEYAIDGKMIEASCCVHNLDIMSDDIKDTIRKNLIHQITEYILGNNLVEFTQMKAPTSLESVVRARCFMVPDDQVKILRSVYKV